MTIITGSFFVVLAIISIYLIKLFLPVKIAYRVAVWTVIIMAIIWSIVKYYIEIPLSLAYLTNLYFDYNKKNNIILKFVEIKKPKKEHNFIFSVIALTIIFIINCSFMYDISMEQVGYFFLKRPQVTAHRGSSRLAPENSMPAFLQAIEDQADYIELDVRETKDEKIVVIHVAVMTLVQMWVIVGLIL